MDAKTLCLGALLCGEASGYEIRRLYEDGPFSTFHPTSFGAIYPALTALLAEGLVTVRAEAQDRRPDKKVYALTETGRAALAEAVAREPAADKFRSDMLFVLAYSHLLPPGRVTQLLDRYLTEQQALYAKIAASAPPEDLPPGKGDEIKRGGAFIRGLGLAVHAALITYIKQNRHLLDAPPPDRDLSDGEQGEPT